MARIRTIKPEFFLNEQLASCQIADRLLFIGLWTQADRAGRLEDRPLRLKAALFPYDDLDIEQALGRLANARLIHRYEGNGQRLIAIPTWQKHQQPHIREKASELPAPPGWPDADMVPAPDKPVGREGKGTDQEGNGTSALRARFDRFWAEYPKKVGKDAAWRVWQRKQPGDDLTDQMLAAVRRQRTQSQWMKDGGQFIPNPSTWLHQGRWQDEPLKVAVIQQPRSAVPSVEETRRYSEAAKQRANS